MSLKTILATLVVLAVVRHAAAQMKDDDLDDDSYSRRQGSASRCPETIRFKTENSLIEEGKIEVNDEECDGDATISLAEITSSSAASSPAVRYFVKERGDVDTFLAGNNNKAFTCGDFDFPVAEWIFLRPEDDVDVVWKDVFGTDSSPFDDDEVELDDGERYLIIGNTCFYRDTSFTDRVCFPADATVQLEDGSVKAMHHLSIGDRVLVAGGEYSDVFAWTHKDAAKKYPFVQLETEDGQKLSATASHYVYADAQTIQMKHVKVGMSLRLADGAASRVVSKSRVVKQGLFNPQTTQGDIVVNGILATTYTSAIEPEAAHALLAPVRAAFQAVKGLLPVGHASHL